MQKRLSLSIDEKIVGSMNAVSAKKGKPLSEIAERYFMIGLKNELELTSAERLYFQRQGLDAALDSVLIVHGVKVLGSLTDKFTASLSMLTGFRRVKNRKSRYGELEISIFSIVAELKEYDINLFSEWITIMGYFGDIRKRYFNLYTK